MLLSARPVRVLFEAMDASGVAVEPILQALGLERARFASDDYAIPWSTFVRFCSEVSVATGHDVERLRAVGRAMTNVPSYAPLRRLARTVVSVRALYRIGERWIAPAHFPHLRLFIRSGTGRRLYVHGSIPSAHEGCEAFLQIAVGSIAAVPTLLDLPSCEIIAARVDTRELDLELALPARHSLVTSAVRAVSALGRRSDRDDALEVQRGELSRGLDVSRRARDELRAVLEALPAIVVIHVDGRIAFVNRAFVRTLGWSSPEELLGRPLIESVDPRSHALFLARTKRPPGTPDIPEVTECWLTTRDGDPVLVECAPTQSIVLDGLPARLVVGRDMAERDRLHQQLATADRLASLGLLAAGVAHEVNNPLAYLLNNIEIATKHLGPNSDVARSALQIAIEGAERIRFIVRELLLLAREDPSVPSQVDLAGVVASTLALARVEIERTARVVVDIEPVAPVVGSAPRIAQIVLNLVLNALEAMRLRHSTDGELVVRVRRSGDCHVSLEIADNGVGVNAGDLGRILDPFFTTKPPGNGTGLGLAVTQRLVGELGGQISCASERGRGATFRVLFQVFEQPRLERRDVQGFAE